jgi:serine protease inhibitor
MTRPIDRRTFLASAAAAVLGLASRGWAATPADVLAAQAVLSARLVGHLAKGAAGITVVSPASLGGALAVIALGGDDALRTSLQKLIGFAKPADPAGDLDAIRQSTARDTEGQPFSSANAILFDSALTLEPTALDMLAKAGVRASAEDFAKPETLAAINGWVEERTKGKIPKVVDDLPRGGGLVALNALYFKDKWKHPFDPAETKPTPFRLVGRRTVEAPLMRASDVTLRFRQNDRFVAADLPYATAGYSLVVVTTKKEPAPAAAFAGLGAWLTGAGFADSPGEVALPRFDASSGIDLLPVLAALGFMPPAALPRFASGPMRLAKVQQRVELKVDEEGTEAAAATAAIATRSAATPFVKMTADKPFMFALREQTTGLIIVAGYVANPVVASRAALPRRGRVMRPGQGGSAIPPAG